MYPVLLHSPRLTLREVDLPDAPAILAIATHPDVVGRVMNDTDLDLGLIEQGVRAWQDAARAAERVHYELAIVVAGALVGSVRLTGLSAEHHRGEVGYVVHPDHWGQGLATEAAGLLVRYAFDTLTLHRVEAGTHPDNVASQRVLEKIGMRAEGRARDYHLVDDAWQDSLRYAVLATDPRSGHDPR